MTEDVKLTFLRSRHTKFFQRSLRILPSSTVAYDTSRMTALFFILSGLDILNALQDIKETDRVDIIEWIYSLQVLPSKNKGHDCGRGFHGGTSLRLLSDDIPESIAELDCGHIAMSYTALASLIILGDDLSRIDRRGLLNHVKALQCSDGSFYSTLGGSENDMRFVYCAAAICYMLRDFSAINIDSAVDFIFKSMSYEGAIGQGQFHEAHGGSTYCAVAALKMMGCIDSLSVQQRDHLISWLMARQDIEGGLHGRPNKPADTCYTFWVGAALKLLDAADLINVDRLHQFVLSTQDPITGGLAKYQDSLPDGLHTYLGISGLSLFGCDDLQPVDPALNISERAVEHLKKLQDKWPQWC